MGEHLKDNQKIYSLERERESACADKKKESERRQ